MTRSALFALMLAAPVAASASGFQETVLIDRAVAQFTARPIGAEGGARAAVDQRLKLAPCPMLALAWYGPAHDSVLVTCPGPDWRLFVPVVQPAKAADAASGTAQARPAIVIKRGDPVTIEAGAAGFSVTREGTALADAPAGGRLLVQVDGVRQPVQAVAIETGRVTLPGYAP